MSIGKVLSKPHIVYQPVTLPLLHTGPSNLSPPQIPTSHIDTLLVYRIWRREGERELGRERGREGVREGEREGGREGGRERGR